MEIWEVIDNVNNDKYRIREAYGEVNITITHNSVILKYIEQK